MTLDDDVAAAVDLVRRERGLGLSAAVNELVRRGMMSRLAQSTFPRPTADLGIGILCSQRRRGAGAARGARTPLMLVDANILVVAAKT